MYFLSLARVLNTPCCFDKIKWTFVGQKFPRKQEAKRVHWNSPLLANTLTLGPNCRGRNGKSAVVHTIGCGREPLTSDVLFQVEAAIGFADVQESVDTA